MPHTCGLGFTKGPDLTQFQGGIAKGAQGFSVAKRSSKTRGFRVYLNPLSQTINCSLVSEDNLRDSKENSFQMSTRHVNISNLDSRTLGRLKVY